MGQAGATPIRSRGTGGCRIGKQPQLMTPLLNSASSSALLFHQIQETRSADLLFNKSAAKGGKRCSGDPIKDLVFPIPTGMGIQQNQRQDMEVRVMEVAVWDWKALAQLCLCENDFKVKRRRDKSQLLLFPSFFGKVLVFWEVTGSLSPRIVRAYSHRNFHISGTFFLWINVPLLPFPERSWSAQS